jgi:hypothetical protein
VMQTARRMEGVLKPACPDVLKRVQAAARDKSRRGVHADERGAVARPETPALGFGRKPSFVRKQIEALDRTYILFVMHQLELGGSCFWRAENVLVVWPKT